MIRDNRKQNFLLVRWYYSSMYDLNIFNNSFKTPTLRFLFIANDKFFEFVKN